jgi:tetratricopeptide (TPR) repeat protein
MRHATLQGLTILWLVVGWSNSTRAEEVPPPQSSPEERARPHVEAGQAAFGEERWEQAITEFQAAYDLIQEPMLLYNIAVCHERLEQRHEAVDFYFRYISNAPEARNADEVRERIDRLQRERVEDRDRELEIVAVDTDHGEDRPLPNLRRTQLEEANHELGLLLGTNLALHAVHTDVASFSLVFGYHYRITPTWHVGGELLMDWFGKTGDPLRQSHYGLVLGGRWALQFARRFELHLQAGLGYQLLARTHDVYEHWAFLRMGATLVWDVYRGFGFRFSINNRMGFLSFDAPNLFGVSLDLGIGLFWAI